MRGESHGDGEASRDAAPAGHGAPAAGAGPVAPEDEVVPRLPRGRGLTLSRPEMLRIAGLAILLVFLVVSQRPCANAVSGFVTSFGDGSAAKVPRPAAAVPGGSAAPAGSAAAPAEGGDLGRYERLRPGMTDEEVKALIDRARAKAAGADPAPR